MEWKREERIVKVAVFDFLPYWGHKNDRTVENNEKQGQGKAKDKVVIIKVNCSTCHCVIVFVNFLFCFEKFISEVWFLSQVY